MQSTRMTDFDILVKHIAANPELFEVVSRHGLSEDDLLSALRSLRDLDQPADDLWAIVTRAARMKNLRPAS
jgi:hypothetical protein